MMRLSLFPSTDPAVGYEGFHLTGHADFGPYGADLLCASVSGIVTALVNTLTDASDLGEAVSTKVASGDVAVRLVGTLSSTQKAVWKTLITGFALNMEQLQGQHPKHIEISNGGQHDRI